MSIVIATFLARTHKNNGLKKPTREKVQLSLLEEALFNKKYVVVTI